MALCIYGFFLSVFIAPLAGSRDLEYTDHTIYQNVEENEYHLAGYFGVHRRGDNEGCDKAILEDDIYLMEAMRYAIKQINDDPSKLFGLKLGFKIIETCRTIRFLRLGMDENVNERCFGAVGPATSDEAILTTLTNSILQHHVISYSATSIELKDRLKYINFYSMVPPDNIQSLALRDVLKHFNWTYISTVSSYGANGHSSMKYVIELAQSGGICIATQNILPDQPTASDYEHVIRNLEKDPNAKTIVLFTTPKDTRQLFLAARSSNVTFTWLSSAAWAADFDTIRGVEKVAKGAILLNYEGINNAKFHNYFMNLTYEHNKYPWFKEFWESTFNCSLSGVEKMKRCYGNESLLNSRFYGKYAPAQAVLDAVNVHAYTLRCAIDTLCPMDGKNKTQCAKELLNLEIAFEIQEFAAKRHRNCRDVFGRVNFKNNGFFYRNIEILNFDGQTYRNVGDWGWNRKIKTSKLHFKNTQISWPGKIMKVPISICSQPCREGERMVRSKIKDCCFICHACQADEVLRNDTCYKCGKYQLPNSKKAICFDLRKMHVKITNYTSVIVILGSVIGFLANSFVLYLFIRHRDSKIVKASSRQLSFCMLAGLYLCFISPSIFLLQPTVVRCGFRRFIFGISLTACYTPLMLKTIRIYRIFKAALVKVSLPHVASSRSQLLICLWVLTLQLLFAIMWVVGDPPVVIRVIVDEYKLVADLCSVTIFSVFINLIFCVCMLVTSTVFAFKSRICPNNFNEAYHIVITMYLSCFLWAILIPLLLVAEVQTTNPFARGFVKATFMNVIGIISLIGLFGPKVRRLIFFVKSGTHNVIYTSGYSKTGSTNTRQGRSMKVSFITFSEKDKEEDPGKMFIASKMSRRKSF